MSRILSACLLSLVSVCVCPMSELWSQEVAPTAEHKKLAELAGKWTFVLKSEGPESKGTCEYKLECGGLWLSSDFNTDFGGVKFQGRGLDGYDPDKKKYVSVWVDSMTTAPMFFEGGYDAKGEKLIMTAKGRGPDGQMGVWRSVTIIPDKNKHTFEMYYKPEGGQETKMMTVEYTRS